MRRFAMLALLAAGCGGSPRRGAVTTPRPTAPPAALPALAGRWARASTTAVDGDREEVRERWNLMQTGASVFGHYVRVVTRTSVDGNVYACNRGDSYTRRARVAFDGRLGADGTVTLMERAVVVAPGLCDDGVRRLAGLRGKLVGGRVELVREGEAVLLEPDVPGGADDPEPAPQWSAAPQPDGLWQSVVSRRDQLGQLRTEFEVWHLTLEGRDLGGYYDHVVTMTAREGHSFACSGAAEYTLRTRYRVAGMLDGSALFLNETSYDTVPGPCETNQRRLERYQGRLAGDEMVLVWGGGAELLRRVPTR